MASGAKSPGAFRTIGELSQELGVAQHILRYWETRFPQLKPMQRAGNRRYYRPADVDLVRKIDHLLNKQGYTVKGVQQVLKSGETATEAPGTANPGHLNPPAFEISRLIAVRERLVAALEG